jgi:hypothetical protein
MEILKDFIIDNLNGFAFDQLPLFIFQLLTAGLFAFCFQFIFNRKFKNETVQFGVLTAVIVAFLASLVKGTLSFSVLGAAAILLFFKSKSDDKLTVLSNITFIVIGIGCGIGSVVQTGIGLIVVGIVLLLTPLKGQDA